MTEETPKRQRAGLWLAAGVTTGVLVTAGLAYGANSVFGSTLPASAAEPPHFVEESKSAGIDHVYDGEFTFFVGGGVAVFDCNDDRRPDLYLAGGANPAGLFRNDSPTGGALAFTDIGGPATQLVDVTGAYPLDVPCGSADDGPARRPANRSTSAVTSSARTRGSPRSRARRAALCPARAEEQ